MSDYELSNGNFIWSLSIIPQDFYSLKREKSDFTMEKTVRHSLSQVIKFNATSNIMCYSEWCSQDISAIQSNYEATQYTNLTSGVFYQTTSL